MIIRNKKGNFSSGMSKSARRKTNHLKEDNIYLQNITGMKITVIFNILTTAEFMDLK